MIAVHAVAQLPASSSTATCAEIMLVIGEHDRHKSIPDGTAFARRLRMLVSDEALHGRVVISGDGVAVGEIARLLVDPSDLRVRALEVRLRRDVAERLGFPHGLFRTHTIEIPSEQVQSVGDAVILAVAVDALRAPTQQASESEPAPTPAP